MAMNEKLSIILCPISFSNTVMQWHSKNGYSTTTRKIWHYSKNHRIWVFYFLFTIFLQNLKKKNPRGNGADGVSVCPGITLVPELLQVSIAFFYRNRYKVRKIYRYRYRNGILVASWEPLIVIPWYE